jgi:hypothetical protein
MASEISEETMQVIDAWRASIHEERDRITDEAIGRLSPREQRLVREAAVMGYVLGGLGHRPFDEPVPPDTHIYRYVVCEAVKKGDLFPFLAGEITEAPGA